MPSTPNSDRVLTAKLIMHNRQVRAARELASQSLIRSESVSMLKTLLENWHDGSSILWHGTAVNDDRLGSSVRLDPNWGRVADDIR